MGSEGTQWFQDNQAKAKRLRLSLLGEIKRFIGSEWASAKGQRTLSWAFSAAVASGLDLTPIQDLGLPAGIAKSPVDQYHKRHFVNACLYCLLCPNQNLYSGRAQPEFFSVRVESDPATRLETEVLLYQSLLARLRGVPLNLEPPRRISLEDLDKKLDEILNALQALLEGGDKSNKLSPPKQEGD